MNNSETNNQEPKFWPKDIEHPSLELVRLRTQLAAAEQRIAELSAPDCMTERRRLKLQMGERIKDLEQQLKTAMPPELWQRLVEALEEYAHCEPGCNCGYGWSHTQADEALLVVRNWREKQEGGPA